jgi:hypothetical protein
MAGKYTSDELELLTEEERAGLIEEQGAPEEVKADPEAGKEPVVEAAAEAAPEAAAAEPEKVDPPAVAAEPAPEELKTEAQPKTAVPNWTVPADTDAKLQALDAKETEVETKFQAGEVTNAEYREQVRAIDKERRAIEGAKLKAEIAAETKAAVWAQQTVSGFLDAHPIYGQNETLFAALDIEVRKLQASAADPFSPSILSKAHAKVQAAFSALGGPKEAPAAEKPKVEAKPAAKVPEKQIEVKPRDPVPPSLAKVPAAEVESTDGGKFAYLDRLQASDYEAFEVALSKLPPADLNAYLASA